MPNYSRQVFAGAMDQDSADGIIREGDYRLAVNLSIVDAEDGSLAWLKATAGNKPYGVWLDEPVLGENAKGIGWAEDIGNNRAILALCDPDFLRSSGQFGAPGDQEGEAFSWDPVPPDWYEVKQTTTPRVVPGSGGGGLPVFPGLDEDDIVSGPDLGGTKMDRVLLLKFPYLSMEGNTPMTTGYWTFWRGAGEASKVSVYIELEGEEIWRKDVNAPRASSRREIRIDYLDLINNPLTFPERVEGHLRVYADFTDPELNMELPGSIIHRGQDPMIENVSLLISGADVPLEEHDVMRTGSVEVMRSDRLLVEQGLHRIELGDLTVTYKQAEAQPVDVEIYAYLDNQLLQRRVYGLDPGGPGPVTSTLADFAFFALEELEGNLRVEIHYPVDRIEGPLRWGHLKAKVTNVIPYVPKTMFFLVTDLLVIPLLDNEDAVLHETCAPLRGMDIIDDYLYYLAYIDGAWRPRRFHIGAAVLRKHPELGEDMPELKSGVVYPERMDEGLLRVGFPAPIYRPEIEYTAGASNVVSWNESNNVQFAFRYEFVDGGYSPLSDYSAGTRAPLQTESVTVSIPFDEQIPASASTIEWFVREYGRDAPWERFATSDLATVRYDHNNRIEQAHQEFIDPFTATPVDPAELIQTTAGHPVAAEAQSANVNRIFYGNVQVGRKPATSGSGTFTAEQYTPTPFSADQPGRGRATTFAEGSQVLLGIEYFDEEKRSAGVLPLGAVTFPRSVEQGNTKAWRIAWDISAIASADIPDWADYYRISRTEDVLFSDYQVIALERTDDSVPPLFMHYVRLKDGTYDFVKDIGPTEDRVALAINLEHLTVNDQGYDYVPGDVAYIASNAPGDTTRGFFRTTVIGVTDGYILVNPLPSGTYEDFDAAYDAMVVLTSPRPADQDKIYYGATQVFEVTDPGTRARSLAVTSGELYGSDYRIDFPYIFRSIGSAKIDSSFPFNFEDEEYLQMNRNRAITMGTPSLKSDPRLATRIEEMIVPSGRLLADTLINDLGSFSAFDRKVLDTGGGGITALAPASRTETGGGVMLAICEHETYSCYLGETQLVDQDSDQIVGAVQAVIGTVRQLKGGYGCHPDDYATVAAGSGFVYWWDEHRKSVIQYSNNGLRPISDEKMSRPFRSAKPKVGMYSNREKRYYLNTNINLLQDAAGPRDLVMVFDTRRIAWLSATEGIFDVSGEIGAERFSFYGGELYRFERGLPFLNGEEFRCQIGFFVNAMPGTVKIPRAVSVSGAQPSRVYVEAKTHNVTQNCVIPGTWGRRREGVWSYPVMRDSTTPGMDPTVALRKGRLLRATEPYVALEWKAGDGDVRDLVLAEWVGVNVQTSTGNVTLSKAQ